MILFRDFMRFFLEIFAINFAFFFFFLFKQFYFLLACLAKKNLFKHQITQTRIFGLMIHELKKAKKTRTT